MSEFIRNLRERVRERWSAVRERMRTAIPRAMPSDDPERSHRLRLGVIIAVWLSEYGKPSGLARACAQNGCQFDWA